MKRIKVVRIITRMNIGGPAIQAVLLSCGLDRDRFDSRLVAGKVGDNEGDMSYLATENGVEPLIISELRREPSITNDVRSLFKLYRFIKRVRPEIVHTHTAKAGTIGRLAAWLAGVPVIIHTFHGHVFHSYFNSRRSGFFVFIERLIAKITDKIVVISRAQKDEIVKYLKLKDDKIALIPLGFDLERFLRDDSGDKRDKMREEFDIPKEAIVVGIIGRLAAVKNHRMFFEATKDIKNNNSGRIVRFLIAGDGELKNELITLSKKLGTRDDIVFADWRKDMDAIYKAIDIVALTSLNEGTPVSLIEALASAKAVVATDVGGVRDIVENEKSGFIVTLNDVARFSKAVSELVGDEQKRKRFGLCGREFVRKRYSKERLIRDIENLYTKELQIKIAVEPIT